MGIGNNQQPVSCSQHPLFNCHLRDIETEARIEDTLQRILQRCFNSCCCEIALEKIDCLQTSLYFVLTQVLDAIPAAIGRFDNASDLAFFYLLCQVLLASRSTCCIETCPSAISWKFNLSAVDAQQHLFLSYRIDPSPSSPALGNELVGDSSACSLSTPAASRRWWYRRQGTDAPRGFDSAVGPIPRERGPTPEGTGTP